MNYLLATLLSLSLLFGYLSYSFYSSKEKAEGALQSALDANTSLTSSLSKKEQECRITDEVISEWQKEKDASDKQKDSDIQKIDKLPSVASKKPDKATSPNVAQEGKQNEEIDIDAKLPDTLRLLLQQSYNRNKGSASDNSRQSFD